MERPMQSTFLLLSPVRRAWPLVGLALALAGCSNVGPEGPTGPEGPPGATGAPGPQGEPGQDGYLTLVQATTLPRGDAECPFGGTRYDTGVDNGDGGGVAGNGTLEPGEVDGSSSVCGVVSTASLVDAPTTPTGTATIDLHGGDGVSTGGQAGSVQLQLQLATGGHVAMFRNGTVDASFDMPGTDYVNLGSNPLVVGAGETVTPRVISAGSEGTLNDGDLYRYQDNFDGTIQPEDTDEHLYRWSVANGRQTITGIRVDASGTLVLPYAASARFPSSGRVAVADDIDNAGTISASLTGQSRYRLRLWATHFYGEAGSNLDQRGLDAGSYGGEGGAVFIYAVRHPEQASTICDDQGLGGVYNQGTIDTRRGVDLDSVGLYPTGTVTLCGATGVYNTGDILASGRPGPVQGGNGASISFMAPQGGVFNSGALDVSGADDTVGGTGGNVSVDARRFVNSGPLDLSGGSSPSGRDCTASVSGCAGGHGGSLSVVTRGGRVANTGDAVFTGGDTASGTSGAAGTLSVNAMDGYDSFVDASLAPGRIDWTGDLDGWGGTGGDAGGRGAEVVMSIQGSSDDRPEGEGITLYGYQGFEATGGSGVQGGGGGALGLWNQPSIFPNGRPGISGGPAYLDAPVEASGGAGVSDAAATTWGGAAGSLQVSAFANMEDSAYLQATVFADFHALGGDGTHGAYGGYLSVQARHGLTFDGSVDIRSGTGDPATGTVSDGAGVYLAAGVGPAEVTMDLDGRGGDAFTGGEGAPVDVQGAWIDFSGTVDTTGGAGSTSGGTGGDGGDVNLLGTDNGSVVQGTFTTDAGVGSTPGTPGHVTVDGFPWN